jgi:TldD protein
VVGVENDLVDYTLEYALTKPVGYAEAKAVRTYREDFVLRNGVLDAYAVSVDRGYNVRILADGGLGFASSNRWTKDEARSAVDTALRYAHSARRSDRIEFAEEESVQTRWRVEEAVKLVDVSYEEKVQRLVEVDKAVTSLNVNVASRQLTCSTRLTDRYFVNSEGTRIASSVPFVNVEANGVTVRANGKTAQLPFKQYGYTGGWEAFERWQIEVELAREVQQLHRTVTEGRTVIPGKMDVICGPEVTGIASHESCGHPMEADRILGREMSQAGRSFIYPAGPYWLGSRIGSELVTIVDDPTVAHSAGYYRYDDEGIAARPRYLYKDGVINEFLQNRETAAKLGTRSNGASRAVNYDREAIVRMANTYLQPGDMTEAELFEGVQQGVYIHSFTEWNIDDVRFNQRYVGREAYLIEDGEVSHPVVRPTIETTTPAFWRAVDGVSKDVVFDSATCGKGDPMQGAPVFTGGPLMRLRGLHIR